LRAGIEAVHPSQRIAARSLGLSHAQTLRLVVIPQGLRKVVPAAVQMLEAARAEANAVQVR